MAPPRFNFILQPEFPMNALILASDALRIANQNSGSELFSWRFVSGDGSAVRASNGMWLTPDHALDAMPPADVYLVFEGNLPTQHNSPALLGHLRAASRFGALVGGIDTGTFALAQAGLAATADSPEVVLHWEAAPTFQERFPDAHIEDAIVRLDGNRAYCAGGVATLDLMLDLIARFRGDALATEVADALVHRRRPADTRQRNDKHPAPGGMALASRIVDLMDTHLDFPLSEAELARASGMSVRSLSRFCLRHFGISPMRLYLRVRLQAARNFLFYEEFTIKEIANACGFSSPALFSRSFKGMFKRTPSAFRAEVRASQGATIKPEIRRLIRVSSHSI